MSSSGTRWKTAAPASAAALVLTAGGYWWWTDGTDEREVPGRQADQVLLECGTFDFPACDGEDTQFDPVFTDAATALPAAGGFGGGQCRVERTPVIFVHGNADRAVNWDAEITGPVEGHPQVSKSVYETFLDAGYQPCELFGLTYLSDSEQDDPAANYHRPEKYREIIDFVDEVKAATGRDEVDLVSHSLGVSMSLAALTWHDETLTDEDSAWGEVRRFVNIAGGLHGLGSCRATGPANPIAKTCGAQHLYDPWVFGFHPDSALTPNQWTGSGSDRSLRKMPGRHPEVAFYTITAGVNDQVHCSALDRGASCAGSTLFDEADNVRAQLDVGAGARATDRDPHTGTAFTIAAGDLDGIGHFKARNNTGQILVEMLTSECTGLQCRGDYDAGPVTQAS